MSDPERSTERTLHKLLSALTTPDPPIGSPAPPLSPNAAQWLEGGCAVCRLVRQSVAQSLRAFFAEFVNDPQAREKLRRARGFCAEHTALLAELGDALAVAILYSDLARLTQERWQGRTAEKEGGAKKGLRLNLGRKAVSLPCPACMDRQEAEARYIGALTVGLNEERVWEALETGSGLCVTHVEQVLAQAAPAHAVRLRQLEAAKLAALQAELEEIIRKNDYRYRGEAWGTERDAWLRALLKITRPS